MGKGSKQRPCLISREEYDLRWAYATGAVGRKEFNKRLEEIRQKKGRIR